MVIIFENGNGAWTFITLFYKKVKLKQNDREGWKTEGGSSMVDQVL